jgi:hypothetical protein
MRPKSRTGKSPSPIEAKQKALKKKSQELRMQEKELQDWIKEAPRLQEEEKKRRRAELASLAGRGDRRIDPPSAIERRYNSNATATRAPRRVLKAEKRQARLQFYVLFLILLLTMAWIYFKVFR